MYLFLNLNHNLCFLADGSRSDSHTTPMEFLGHNPIPTRLSLSALPDSSFTAFKNPDSPVDLSSTSEQIPEAETADTTHFQPSDALVEEPHVQTTSLLNPSKPFLRSIPQFEESAIHSTDWKVSNANSDHEASSFSQSPTKSKQLTENAFITSPSPSIFTGSTPQQGLQNEERATSTKGHDVISEQMQAVNLSTSGQPLQPPMLALSETLTSDFHSQIVDYSFVSSNPNEVIIHGYHVPFIASHSTSSLPEPTEVPSENFYPTNTMDVDWGSGDYLETISFFDPDRDEYSLVTKVPADPFDMEDVTEKYDTSFPSRVVISPTSLRPVNISPSPSLMTAYSTIKPSKSSNPSSVSTTAHFIKSPAPTRNNDMPDISDVDWGDTFTIQPTDVLLPDMNSLEYYTTQLTKENNVSETVAEHGENITKVYINTTTTMPSTGPNDNLTDDESSGEFSGFVPHDESTAVSPTEEGLQLINASETFLDPSLAPTHYFDSSSLAWTGQVSTTDRSVHTVLVKTRTTLAEVLEPSTTPLLPEDVISSDSFTDVHWFVTDSFEESTVNVTTVLTATIATSAVPTEPSTNETAATTEITFQDSFVTEQSFNITSISNEPTSYNVTLVPSVMLGDQGMTEDGVDISATMTSIPTSIEVNTDSAGTTSQAGTTTLHQATTGATSTAETSTSINVISTISEQTTTTARMYLCQVDRPVYLTKIGKSEISTLLNLHFIFKISALYGKLQTSGFCSRFSLRSSCWICQITSPRHTKRRIQQDSGTAGNRFIISLLTNVAFCLGVRKGNYSLVHPDHLGCHSKNNQ